MAKEALTRALEKVKAQKDNFGFLERFDVEENWVVTKVLEKQIPQPPINKQGIPLWGCCPTCGDIVTRYGSPVGCKNCLQRLDWSKT